MRRIVPINPTVRDRARKPRIVKLPGVDLTVTIRLVSRAPEHFFRDSLRGVFADHQPARPARPPRRGEEGKGAAPAWQSAKAGRVHASVHHDAEEAQLRAAQSGPRPTCEWVRSDGRHPRWRPEPAGALDGDE